jgi:hypothetical protein
MDWRKTLFTWVPARGALTALLSTRPIREALRFQALRKLLLDYGTPVRFSISPFSPFTVTKWG